MPKIGLETDIQYVKGVGPKRARQLARLGVKTVYDLLYLPPRRYLDRRDVTPIRNLRHGHEAVVMGEVLTKGIDRSRRGDKWFKVVIGDGTGWLELVWKTTNEGFLSGLDKVFRKGDRVIVSGKVIIVRGGIKQMWFPEYEMVDDISQSNIAGRIIPVYPATEGLKPRYIRKLVRYVLTELEGRIPETIPGYIRKKRGLYSREVAIRRLHFPNDMDEARKAHLTLAYEELLYFFIVVLGRRMRTMGKGVPIVRNGKLTEKFIEELPFEFTDAQRRVISEIEDDMARSVPMHRLLQGDVGSGKTVVALYAMLMAAENGFQAALMAPTEILAEQHFIVIGDFLKNLPIRMRLLTGHMRKKEREAALYEISNGEADIVVGTHAIIQEEVRFHKLAFAVVDEQHKFGVVQRAKLLEKGIDGTVPHFLVMTATPIPRTLAMTIYGDLDVSVLDEKPPGRGKIVTKHRTEEKRADIYRWLFERVQNGDQAYVVAPLIEKSEKLEVKAVEELFEELKSMAPEGVKIGLIHGRMKKDERQFVMQAFRDGQFHILVATTVIEVGIDVKNATIMVIEHAERFGLAQLHQLRGRIGRGEKTSYCIVVTPKNISEDARKRIRAFVSTTDGFKLAEYDLQIRGPGELYGTRQHGIPDFRIVDLVRDQFVMSIARQDARDILRVDPRLQKPQHQIIRKHFRILKEKEVSYVVA